MRSSEPPPHQHAAPSVVASCLSNSRITSALWRYSHPLHVVAGAGLAPTPASVLGRTLLSSLQCLQHVLQQLLRQLRPPRSPCCPPPPLPPLECHHDQKTLNPVKTEIERGARAARHLYVSEATAYTSAPRRQCTQPPAPYQASHGLDGKPQPTEENLRWGVDMLQCDLHSSSGAQTTPLHC
jgi:hypothetical protein